MHASDADQAEALLSRWGPDGVGKLGGIFEVFCLMLLRLTLNAVADPRWAGPIKYRIRQHAQAKAVNEVVNALNPSLTSDASNVKLPLRVVNGMSTPTASTVTTIAAAVGTIRLPPVEGLPHSSTVRILGGVLVPHVEHEDEGDPAIDAKFLPEIPQVTCRTVTPSLQTLEKAVAAKIYFENLYFPLLRLPPSREQRRLAMEREMELMQLTEVRKEELRARWRQNETDYLRERRQKLDVSAFVRLKTIGHGAHEDAIDWTRTH